MYVCNLGIRAFQFASLHSSSGKEAMRDIAGVGKEEAALFSRAEPGLVQPRPKGWREPWKAFARMVAGKADERRVLFWLDTKYRVALWLGSRDLVGFKQSFGRFELFAVCPLRRCHRLVDDPRRGDVRRTLAVRGIHDRCLGRSKNLPSPAFSPLIGGVAARGRTVSVKRYSRAASSMVSLQFPLGPVLSDARILDLKKKKY
jgi:hypothetical protein